MITPIAFVSVHVRESAQAVALGPATVAASLPSSVQQHILQINLYLHQDLEEMVDSVIASRASVIALSIYVWNHRVMVALAEALRQQSPDLLLLAAGPEVTAAPQVFSDMRLFDSLVCGEGEDAMSLVVDHIKRQKALHPFYRNEKPVDLALQPSPWLEGCLVPGEGVLWEVSRGCPFRCSFCFDARGEFGVRTYPFARLEEELTLFVRHNVSQVWVLDSTFNYPPQRGKELVRLIERIAPHLHFHFEAKVEFIDEELAELLAGIQCSVQIGLQSANPDVVRHVHRNFDADLFMQKVSLLQQAGVTYGIDLMYGLPGDDEAGLKNSLEFALQLQPNHVDLFPLAVLPGTELHQRRQDYGLRAEETPPYRLLASREMDEQAMARCAELAAWTDFFYNVGRAVGFFSEVCHAVDLSAVAFIEAFGNWLLRRGVSGSDLICKDWPAATVTELQQEFFRHWLTDNGHDNLCEPIEDMVHFHMAWSQAQLFEDITETDCHDDGGFDGDQNWCWRNNATLHRFYFDLNEWLLVGGDLVEQAEFGDRCGSVALFFRADGQAQCITVDGIDASCFPCGVQLPSFNTLVSENVVKDPQCFHDWLDQAVTFGLLVRDEPEGC